MRAIIHDAQHDDFREINAGCGYARWAQGKGSYVTHLGRTGRRGAGFAGRRGGQYFHRGHLRRLHVAL